MFFLFDVLTEKLAHAKEENLEMNQMLDQTLMELNNMWASGLPTHPTRTPFQFPTWVHLHLYSCMFAFVFKICGYFAPRLPWTLHPAAPPPPPFSAPHCGEQNN